MKGKGEKGKSSHNSSSLLVEDVQESFANIKPFDHTKHCFKYTSMVIKDEICEYSDLDKLEGDLQTMLSSTLRRIKYLNSEVHGLNAWQEKTRVVSSPSLAEHSGQKRGSKGKIGDERPPKRVRTDSGRATYAVYNKGKGKDQQDSSDHTHQHVKAPKNVTPNRFWSMVDTYCAEITSDDVAFLEEQLRVYGEVGEYMRVPQLGRHYSEQWNDEDAKMEEREASKLPKRYNSTFTTSNKPQQQHNTSNNTDHSPTLKRTETSDSDCAYGDLAQRLVQGLIEEEVMMPASFNEDLSMPPDAELSEFANMSSSELAQQLNISNSDLLEDRLKKELVNLGIFGDKGDEKKRDKSDTANHKQPADNEEGGKDEILRELRKKQAELRALSAQNVEVIKALLRSSREEVVKGRLRRKLNTLDIEVTEAYKKYQALKAKRKTVTKKDSEHFFRLLSDRKVLLRQINKKHP